MTAMPEPKLTEIKKTVNKKPKEKVWLPVKVPLMKDKKTWEVSKTWMISIFTWTPRRDRRVKARDRVRESSPETFHPANKADRAEKYYAIRKIKRLKNKRK